MESLGLAAVLLGAVLVVFISANKVVSLVYRPLDWPVNMRICVSASCMACFNAVTSAVACEPMPSTFLARGW